MKLTLVLSSLRCGGAERAATILAAEWRAAGHGVEICLLSGPGEAPFYPIPDGVAVRHLDVLGESNGPFRAVIANLRRIRAVRRSLAASRPDVVIAFMLDTSVTTLLAAAPLALPVVISEHADPESYPVSRIWSLLRDRLYRRASVIVVLSRSARSWFERFPVACRVLPNPVTPAAPAAATPGDGRRRVCVVGRLDYLKGVDIAIEAFSRVADRFADWDLVICGDGPRRHELEQQAGALQAIGRVRFLGQVADIAAVYRSCHLFLLPSRTEAFPMALCEAMAHGLCPLVTRFNSDVDQLVRHGIDGIVVDRHDADAVAVELAALLGDDPRRERYAASARRYVSRFSPAGVAADWIALLTGVALTGRSR